ncbi:aldehyde dehydrogenase family protein [Candidatus Viridilinea mediisalina]|uniref:Aldehyde dehydrogenase n=1 Tax=Candidatus Viridilinea mediisalina TaxID=2024553 RepID=A0A2A6RMC0_9CHLR|nr:aldehyde dehydrogenase family protein [Candidatus Viridilinea mediisalina]PDW04051.1 aldehyde dehydrogenase [Candidatus Viridilinea mediisalina]
MPKMIASGLEWNQLLARLRAAAPEAFGADGHVLNLIGGDWSHPGHGKHYANPVDGNELGRMPMIDLDLAKRAVRFAAQEHTHWSQVDLDERKSRVAACLEELRSHRDLIAHLLMWEIGKPFALACDDIDRCISGVEWYLGAIEPMLAGRTPLGLISNIASWNYPYSVLMHSVLVQTLAGNAAIAKTPTDGGMFALTLGFALARRAGLPVSLVSGSGGLLSDALVRNPDVACLAFVGGKSNGRDIAASLYDREKRYMLEMEGVNCYGIWEYSDWPALAAQIKKGFAYGKQRCTAYIRFVVQRGLFPKFLDTYLPAVKSLQIGHPLLVDSPDDPLPTLDFGPLINSRKVEELRVMYSEAIGLGAISLFEGELDPNRFLPGQDNSAYLAPITLLNVPRNARFHHNEPFGPVDTIVVVDRIEEMISEMNISNGNLVSSIATDDPQIARMVAGELRSFKVGINQVRSRGDREEVFGGMGASWKGCFVGGKYLVQSVTQGEPNERLYGNFPDYTLLPETR